MDNKTTMCPSHFVGSIANKQISAEDWNNALRDFIRKVEDFNIRGQREEISHPGFAHLFKFCPMCGTPIDAEKLELLTYLAAYEEIRPLNK